MFGKKTQAQLTADGYLRVKAVQVELAEHRGVHDLVLKQIKAVPAQYEVIEMHPPISGLGSALSAETFDDAFYFARNPDVAAIYGSQAQGGWLHWQSFGQKEGRIARSIYDPKTAQTDAAIEQVTFICNVCGKENTQAKLLISNREAASCQHCHSSLRMRSMVHALSMSLFGESLTLPNFPNDKTLNGIGMSDWDGYARPLAEKLAYTNTFYHTEPRLDIVNIEGQETEQYDFILSSDVFEHIPPPVSIAFENSVKLLKSGGYFVFMVPYRKEGETVEHFPELHNYRLVTTKGKRFLINTTQDGREQVFDNLIFHGGEGFTIEMRLFSEQSLLQDLTQAGFSDIKIYNENVEQYGIIWSISWAMPIVAKKA